MYSGEYKRPGESSYHAGKKDRRQNCETLSCFIKLHVLCIQKQGGLFIKRVLLICHVARHSVCLEKSVCPSKAERKGVHALLARNHPISCQNTSINSSEL